MNVETIGRLLTSIDFNPDLLPCDTSSSKLGYLFQGKELTLLHCCTTVKTSTLTSRFDQVLFNRK